MVTEGSMFESGDARDNGHNHYLYYTVYNNIIIIYTVRCIKYAFLNGNLTIMKTWVNMRKKHKWNNT